MPEMDLVLRIKRTDSWCALVRLLFPLVLFSPQFCFLIEFRVEYVLLKSILKMHIQQRLVAAVSDLWYTVGLNSTYRTALNSVNEKFSLKFV